MKLRSVPSTWASSRGSHLSGWLLLPILCAAAAGCGRQPSGVPSETSPVAERVTAARLAGGPVQAALTTASSAPSPELAQVDTTKLLVYDLRMDSKDLAALERNAFSNQTVPATFVAVDQTYEHVQVRYRGSLARSWPKKPLKIFFNKDKPFHDQHCLNLNSGWHDPALIREFLAYHIYAACGSPAPEARVVRLNLNGKFRGLYIQVEQPDKTFVKGLRLKGASVYKAASNSNQADERDLGNADTFCRNYEKQTRKEEGCGDLQQFCHELAHTTDVVDFFNRHVDVDRYVNYLAASTLTQNWDGYNKNHYLVYDGQGSKKWFAVPWDLDRTLGDHWNFTFGEARLHPFLGTHQMPGITGWNRLEDRFLSQPGLRARYLDRLAELLQKEFTTEKLFPVMDRLEKEIADDAARDRQRWPAPAPDLHTAMGQVKAYIEKRRGYLLGEVPKLRQAIAVK